MGPEGSPLACPVTPSEGARKSGHSCLGSLLSQGTDTFRVIISPIQCCEFQWCFLGKEAPRPEEI